MNDRYRTPARIALAAALAAAHEALRSTPSPGEGAHDRDRLLAAARCLVDCLRQDAGGRSAEAVCRG
ncbi:hypothetical protein [Nocardiopsis alba]|uniref:Triphosphoribosyl-dephospho-CoA synthase n=1 Tax=Nocardiopsis alba TaxID=53437 RepID=A0ABV5DVJ3_9ACTN